MVFQLSTVLIYFIISVIYISNLWKTSKSLKSLCSYSIYVGVICHLISVYLIFRAGVLFDGSFDNSLFIFALFIVLVFLIYQLKFNTYVLGALVFPLVFLITLPSVVFPTDLVNAAEPGGGPVVLTHILITFLGQAIFTLAFFVGLLYLFEQNRIKSKKISLFLKKFPSLSTLDSINNKCLLIGFPVLTIGLALGIIISKSTWGVFLRWQQKEIWAIITWFLYAFLIYSRLGIGWKGRKAAVGAIVGFIVIVITFIALGYLSAGVAG
ncbi:MAG: c-type cytochrome biogenesis protein CcsB [Deltaproteobacteria bacterium]|nr:MAG: c-type cytochrome biogenesis protein CcsB [Deltaproteobacteria bacterium]